MSSGSGDGFKNLPWPSLAVLLTLVGGALWVQPPLMSLRPTGFVDPLHQNKQLSKVPARLWQDPFEATRVHLESYREVAADERGALAELAKVSLEGTTKDRLDHGGVHALIAMVSNGGGATALETRRRTRQALVSALSTQGFSPSSGGNLDLLFLPEFGDDSEDPPKDPLRESARNLAESPTGSASDEPRSAVIIPYEWFGRDSVDVTATDARNVVLFWLDESKTSARSFDYVESVVNAMVPVGAEADLARAPSEGLQVTLLGPSSSGTLITLLKSAAAPPREGSIREHFRMLSSRSTASAQLVLATVGDTRLSELEAEEDLRAKPIEASSKPSVENSRGDSWEATGRKLLARHMSHLLSGNEGSFVSTIARDDQLAEVIVAELALRGFRWKTDDKFLPDCVALVGEWDSFYGRALPRVFRRAAEGQASAVKVEEAIRTFNYLAGIDGRTSPTVSDPDGRVPEFLAARDTQDNASKTPDWPFGANRMDYLRRLTEDLGTWQRKLSSDGRRLFAIGVVGGDAYDKQLILQALRPQFPNALFFSNDLTAQFAHPSLYHLTRNMVFASSYGLALHTDLQGDVPAFRDVYQTSTYLSGLLALGPRKRAGEQVEFNNVETLLSARAFEISRGGAHLLTPGVGAAVPAISLHPDPEMVLPMPKPLGLGVLAALSVCLLAIPFSKRLRALFRGLRQGRHRGPVFGALLLIGGLTAAGMWALSKLHDRPLGLEEPLSFQGISIWPAEALRLLAALLSAIFLYVAHGGVSRSSKRLERKYHLNPAGSEEPDTLGALEDSFFGVTASESETWDAGVPIHELWLSYRGQARVGPTLARVAFVGVAFAILIACLWGIVTLPRAPYRGDLARRIDDVLTVVSMVALAGLTFYVADQIRLCTDLIRALAKKRTCWPDEARKSVEEKHGMPPEIADEFLDRKFISSRTKAVDKLIFYPFIVLGIAIVGRNRYFDDWRWPLAMTAVIGLLFLAAAACALVLRNAAERSRRGSLERLDVHLQRAVGSDEGARINLIRKVMDDLRNDTSGAFAPLAQLPVVRAVLVPFGGLGTVALIDALAASGI